MNEERGDFISTCTGRKFYPCDPRPEELDIEDIAHALSNICRFTGHLLKFYSVAEHSVRVMRCVMREFSFNGEPPSRQTMLTALMHDASEAYLCDMARPVKHHPAMAGYRDAESKLEQVIAGRFGLIYPLPEAVRIADEIMLVAEARDLHAGWGPEWPGWNKRGIALEVWPIWPMSPKEAKRQFLHEFAELAK